MAQKNATPCKQQLETIKKNGLNPALFVVLQDLQYSMIIKNRFTGEVRMINK